jgi:hypothetical protein
MALTSDQLPDKSAVDSHQVQRDCLRLVQLLAERITTAWQRRPTPHDSMGQK